MGGGYRTTALIAAVMLLTAAIIGPDHQIDQETVSAQQADPRTQPTLVGKQVCRECHAENFQRHANHGHASTFHLLSDTDLAGKYDGQSFDAGEQYGTYHYRADADGKLFVTLPERFGDEAFPLQYVLGSGMHAQTLMTLAADATGQTIGIEHRVTCYPPGRLGRTPGHSQKVPGDALEYFGDSSQGFPLQRCIYCHTTRSEVANEQIHGLIANVNCEKCHGPGSEHVAQARANPNPPPFSVGKDTWDAEAEIQLCGDCHRLPRSVSEKEIREYPKLLVRFQPIGMLRSKCYLESDFQMRCSTCHNPHTSLKADAPGDQIQHCIDCHQPQHTEHVTCPVSKTDGCIDCHMPAIETEQGLSFHDHWIRVHPE